MPSIPDFYVVPGIQTHDLMLARQVLNPLSSLLASSWSSNAFWIKDLDYLIQPS